MTFGLRSLLTLQTFSEIQPSVKLCEEEKEASTGRKFCKGLEEENKEAALSAELTAGRRRNTDKLLSRGDPGLRGGLKGSGDSEVCHTVQLQRHLHKILQDRLLPLQLRQ